MSSSEVPDLDAGYEASIALIDSWGERAQAQVDSAEALQRDIEALSVTRWSPGREVQVTLASSGLLTDVTFGEAARLRSSAALSRDILTAVRGAMDDLQSRIAEITADHGGADGLASFVATSSGRALSAPLAQYRPHEGFGSHSRA